MSTGKREKHTKELLDKEDVTFFTVYIGSVTVDRSMRTMQYDLRTAVTKEAIVKVCSAAKCKQDMKRPKGIRQINKILSSTPKISKIGVNFSVSLNGLKTVRSDNKKTVLNHFMSAISFASSGEPPFKPYVGYVAKDPVYGRACHVFNCFGDAFDVISTIGEAFSIKYTDVLNKHTQSNPAFEFIEVNDGFFSKIFDDNDSANTVTSRIRRCEASLLRSQSEQNLGSLYENIPRRAITSNPSPYLPRTVQNSIFYIPAPELKNVWPRTNYCPSPPGSPLMRNRRKQVTKDDMDIRRSEPHPSPHPSPHLDAPVKPPRPKAPIYANIEEVECRTIGIASSAEIEDIIKPEDSVRVSITPGELLRNLEALESSLDEISAEKPSPLTYLTMSWFHGKICREEAERRLKYQGDYLVRSHGNGQFVLSCMDNGQVRHLLLVDPKGQIRTRDREFLSITDLVTHYATSGECIVSEGCALQIMRPVPHNPT